MKALQFVEWQKPAELREVPVLEPGPGQVLIKVGAQAPATLTSIYWRLLRVQRRSSFHSP
jgi:hypothetical protein